jgi:hypothetical protein
MDRNEIWDQLKSDKGTVYGQRMLDIFLTLADKLKPEHYQELTPDQKKSISPKIAAHIFQVVKNPEDGFRMLGQENFNKIDVPYFLHDPDQDRAEKSIQIILKHHKSPEEFAFEMCLKSKNPEEIIKRFGVEKLYASGGDYRSESDRTQSIIIHAFYNDKLEEIGGFIADKIASMKSEDVKRFILRAFDDKEKSKSPVRQLVIKYRKILSSEEIRLLLHSNPDKSLFLEILRKQGVENFTPVVVWDLLKGSKDPEEILNLIGEKNLKKLATDSRVLNSGLSHIGFHSFVGSILTLDLNFAKYFGSEFISKMDHMDVEKLLKKYEQDGKLKEALEMIKKYHGRLDVLKNRHAQLKDFLG